MTLDELRERLEPALAAAAACDPSDPTAAAAELASSYPADGPRARELRAALVAAADAGLICDRGDDTLRWSRVVKPDATPHDLSVDVVSMSGAGPRHRHPRGEMNLCFALDGQPTFDGHPAGWVVFPPGSTHVPTVTGGRMLIAYFLPAGAMEWVAEG